MKIDLRPIIKFGNKIKRKGAIPLFPDIPAGKNQYSSKANKEISVIKEITFNKSSKLNDLINEKIIIIIIGKVKIILKKTKKSLEYSI